MSVVWKAVTFGWSLNQELQRWARDVCLVVWWQQDDTDDVREICDGAQADMRAGAR